MEDPDSLPFIYSLESIDEKDADLVGNKAMRMARLIKIGQPVPGGFCISTRAYRDHLRKCRAEALMQELEGGSAALCRIRERIISEPLAPELEAQLKHHLGRLDAPLTAVRSSATREDMSLRSFAGLYDTFLGIGNLDSCIESLKKCWASLWTERSHQYMAEDERRHPPLMAVIVQRLVQAESSGVMFIGGNPQDKEARIMIEACFGLGEVLVSGKVTPDRFVIAKKSLRILEQHIAEKRLKIEALPDGSLREYLLEPPESRRASLDGRMIKKLCSLALRAGSLCSEGQDIEWAIEKGKIFFLQQRPITAQLKSASPLRIFSSANLGEVLPDVATPLTQSFAIKLMELPFMGNFRRLGIDFGEPGIMAVIDGRFYYDITALTAIMDQLPGGQGREINTFMGGFQEKLVGRLIRRLPRNGRKPRINLLRFIANFPVLYLRMITSSARKVDRAIDELNAKSRSVRQNPSGMLSGEQIINLLDRIGGVMMRNIPEGAAATSGGLHGLQVLSGICRKWLGDKDGSIVNRLLVATGSIDSADPGIALARLASLARDNRELGILLEGEESYEGLLVALKSVQGGSEFMARWDEFMERHGHHARGEFEFFNPRWSETPDFILSIVKGYLDNNGGETIAEYRKRALDREKLVEECRARLRNPLKRMIFDFFLTRAQRGISMRERYKSETIRQIAFMRMLYLELGNDFVSRAILERQDDIFFLLTEELAPLHRQEAAFNIREIVRERRQEYDRNKSRAPHPIIVTAGAEKSYIPFEADEALEMMTGLGVSPGSAKGAARVIAEGSRDVEIHQGEILVIPYADPGWSPYFMASAGIVIDMGGMLSHASIIARELGIPTVVNVGPATRVIRTGQIIEVDGNSGIVTIKRQVD
jgi:rifampicin phosphotransferase